MNRRQRRGVSLATLLVTLAGVSLILMTLVLGAGAQGTTKMVTSSGIITGVGSTTTTDVKVTIDALDSGAMDTFDLTLGWDPTKVDIANSSAITLFSNAAGTWSAFGPISINHTAGTLHILGVWQKNQPPTNPTCTSVCTLFTIEWTGVGAGTSPITDQSSGIVMSSAGIQFNYIYQGGTVTVNGPATNTPVTPATNTPVTPATNTPVTPATNTPVTPSTNTPVTPATNTPVTPSTNTPTTPSTNTPTGTLTPQPTASGSNTPVPTSTPVTTTPTTTPIPGGPRTYKLYLPEVADDGIPGSGQLVRALSEGVVGRVLGPLLGN